MGCGQPFRGALARGRAPSGEHRVQVFRNVERLRAGWVSFGLPRAYGFCEYRGFVTDDERAQAYWRRNLVVVGSLLGVWFLVSLGCGVLFVDALDAYRIGGFKLGFWFAQQGSIYAFVLLIFVYVILMNRLDRRFGMDERKVGVPRESTGPHEDQEPPP